jgi:hypothetical protein
MSNMYVISSANHDNGPVKIGISNKPENRLKQLQTGYPEKICVKYIEPLSDKVEARSLENKLHKDMKHYRAYGEWFNMSVKEAIAFVQFTVIEYGKSDLDDA